MVPLTWKKKDPAEKNINIYEQSIGQTLQEIGITEYICTMHVTQPFFTHS